MAAIGTFAVVAIMPLGYLLVMPFVESADAASFFTIFEFRQLSLAKNSLAVAGGACLSALILGACLAFVVCKTDMPGRKWFGYGFILPLLIPPYIHAIVWAHASPLFESAFGFDFHSVLGAVFVLTLAYFPFVVMTAMAGLKSIDRNKEEASLIVHGPVKTISRITLPLCLPNMLSGAVFVFVFSVTNVGVPDILRVRVFPLEIFIQFSAFFDTWKATLLSVPIVLATLALIVFQRWKMGDRSYVHIGGGENEPIRFSLGWWGYVCLFACAGLMTCSVAVPICVLMGKAGGISTYARVLETSARPLILSLSVAAAAAVSATLLGAALGYLQHRLKRCFQMPLALLVFLPFAVPATAMGIGLIGVWNSGPFDWIYGAWPSWSSPIRPVSRHTPQQSFIPG